MRREIENFKRWFAGYEEQYAVIGGTACELLMDNAGLGFRATKDIDLVLIVETINPDFGRRFWEYIIAAGYEHKNKSTGKAQFYRFSHPTVPDYPVMIELFAKKPDLIILPENSVISPLPMDEDISSLSAILLDNDYYSFIKQGRTRIEGITVLDAPHLIPLKAKAWLDLSERRASGEQIDSKNIRKHRNDIVRLTELLDTTAKLSIDIPEAVLSDMEEFINRLQSEDLDLKQLGIRGKTKEALIEELRFVYRI